jgi:hypothetical protein
MNILTREIRGVYNLSQNTLLHQFSPEAKSSSEDKCLPLSTVPTALPTLTPVQEKVAATGIPGAGTGAKKILNR